MHNNKIQQITEGSFSNLSKLKTLNLRNNVIPYFPAIDLPLLETLNLAYNLIETMGGIAVPNEIKSL
jgi:Leucine-rich repeat (LRR) protein